MIICAYVFSSRNDDLLALNLSLKYILVHSTVMMPWDIKLLRRSSLHLLSVPLLQKMESLIVQDMQDWKQKLTHLTFMALGTGQSKLP